MVDPAWISELHDHLAAMDEHFVTAMCQGNYQDQQDAARGSLAAVLTSFEKVPELKGVTQPLWALLLALQGLESGTGHPILRSYTSKHGAPSITAAQEAIQSRTIAMCDILVDRSA